ncbi:MAG TPA: cysteine hydrolase [Chloroflexi bacterium]|nr:cysteine hydrolase [Chloroflexota bacterium]
MKLNTLIEKATPFLGYAVDWQSSLPALAIDNIVHGQPGSVALISVDIINGFCYEGPLASPRVAALVEPISKLFKRAYGVGVRNFIVTQDAHVPDALEFESYPPHCIRGTSESKTVAAFTSLPFWNLFEVMPKHSLNSAIGTRLDDWLNQHPVVDTFITVGDCTDLCTYQLAMHLKLRGNAANRKTRVILPVDCVDTYDLPVDIAQEIGAMPHNGDLMHLIFLYNMALNGVEVVAKIN